MASVVPSKDKSPDLVAVEPVEEEPLKFGDPSTQAPAAHAGRGQARKSVGNPYVSPTAALQVGPSDLNVAGALALTPYPLVRAFNFLLLFFSSY